MKVASRDASAPLSGRFFHKDRPATFLRHWGTQMLPPAPQPWSWLPGRHLVAFLPNLATSRHSLHVSPVFPMWM